MLSWSGQNSGVEVDLTSITTGDGTGGVPFGSELLAFAEAIAEWDEEELADTRERLRSAAGEAFMIDAAAVAANFEMMTRVADGTGARFDDATRRARAGLSHSLGIADWASAR